MSKIILNANGGREVVTQTGPENVIIIGENPVTPIRLVVHQVGQTRWNLGGFERRRSLFINGIRALINQDYQINLPYLDYTGIVALEPSDEVILVP